MVHPRKISLTEFRGSRSFFLLESVVYISILALLGTAVANYTAPSG